MPVLEQIQMLYDCQRKEGSPQGTEQRPEPPLLIYVGSRWSSNCHIFEEVLASTEGLPAGIYVSVDLSPEGAKSFEVIHSIVLLVFLSVVLFKRGAFHFCLHKNKKSTTGFRINNRGIHFSTLKLGPIPIVEKT